MLAEELADLALDMQECGHVRSHVVTREVLAQVVTVSRAIDGVRAVKFSAVRKVCEKRQQKPRGLLNGLHFSLCLRRELVALLRVTMNVKASRVCRAFREFS